MSSFAAAARELLRRSDLQRQLGIVVAIAFGVVFLALTFDRLPSEQTTPPPLPPLPSLPSLPPLPPPVVVAAVPDVPDAPPLHALEWDGQRPMVPPPPWLGECAWAPVRGAPGVPLNESYTMCVRQERDIVSDAIKNNGRWADCDSLSGLWRRVGNGGIFVDAGANIGSCTFYMLAVEPAAQVLAVEPMLYNLYYLTRSILAQPSARADDWRARLRVLPLALGANASELPAFVQRGNYGNTVLGVATEASPDNPVLVRTVRLDDVLPSGTYIRLLKADVQGFEMELLRGAERLLTERAIAVMQLEVATSFLLDKGTSPGALCRFLHERGYALHYTNGRLLLLAQCESWDRIRSHAADIVAVAPGLF
jgi:FkbM family methyltransferase